MRNLAWSSPEWAFRAIALACALSFALGGSPAFGSSGGIGGFSGNPAVNGGANCSTCHFGASGASANLQDYATGMQDLTTVASGATHRFRARIIGGPGVRCGFDVSATGGVLIPVALNVRYASFPTNEITHNGAQAFAGDGICRFDFDWQAPFVGSTTFYLLYMTGNSVNFDATSSGDSIDTDTHLIAVLPEPGATLLGVAALLALGALRPRRRRGIRRSWKPSAIGVLQLGAALLARTAAGLPPTEVVMPGSQPPEIVSGFSLSQPALLPLLHSDSGTQACAGCHATGDTTNEILRTWRGSMMGNASRDPVTWAALAIAERDYPGIGDTCIRCHVSKGWIEGRSVPSDGSALLASDADGVTCHLCHRLTRPDGSEPGVAGVQAPPFVAAGFACTTGDANEGVGCDAGTGMPCSGGAPACQAEAFYGNAMIALFQQKENGQDATTSTEIARLGPYALEASHDTLQSSLQREGALCGTCHDVSNPVTGDLAPAHGRLGGSPLPDGSFSGVQNGVVTTKAAFRNPPYAYGVEQRTYSEWVASALATTLVSDFDALPAELRVMGGALRRGYDAASGDAGNYADGTPRAFSCQGCHLRPVNAAGTSFTGPRTDLPLHDLTGANTWAPLAILYLDGTLGGTSRLRLGGGLSQDKRNAITSGVARAEASLQTAVSLQLIQDPLILGNTVRVVNLAGHKLFTGYPEGRRMWLNVKWFGAGNALLREDGAYGALAVQEDLDGDGYAPDMVKTLLAPDDPNTHRYGAESGISQAWAQRLVGPLGVSPGTPLGFDRETGIVTDKLSDAAAAAPGTVTPSFHLALNDVVMADNRIPPWRMDYAEARKRNASPVPDTLYLGEQAPGDGALYLHYDDVMLEPPPGAVRGRVSLLYQTASWEYVQFLWKANPNSNAFLAGVGDDLLEAWLATDMSAPVVMAAVTVPEPSASALAAAAVAALGLRAATRREPRGARRVVQPLAG